MDDDLKRMVEAVRGGTGEDEHLRQMFETMAAMPPTPPGMAESYHRRMSELFERYPNQWVLCGDEWDDHRGETHLTVIGPFMTQGEAVAQWDSMPPDGREGYTVEFLEIVPSGCVLIGSPVIRGLFPAAPQAVRE